MAKAMICRTSTKNPPATAGGTDLFSRHITPMLHPKVLNKYKIFYNLVTYRDVGQNKCACLRKISPRPRLTSMVGVVRADRIYILETFIQMVTVSIIAVLIGLLLPAVQHVR